LTNRDSNPDTFSLPSQKHNHGCRQEQEIVKGQEGLEEAPGELMEMSKLLLQDH